MGWLFGIIIVLVIAAAAYAGSGKLGSMPEQVVDRPGPDLPAGDLSATDLREVRFDVVSRGYSPEQVEAVLDRIADQLDGSLSIDPIKRDLLVVEPTISTPIELYDTPAPALSHDADEPQLGRRGIIEE